MKNITKKQVKTDLETVEVLARRYINAIYGETTNKPSDWENQFKQVKIAMVCIANNLNELKIHMSKLTDDSMPLVEDED